jgi:hypothetical protein
MTTLLPALSAAVIESGRLVLRKAREGGCEGIVEVLTDPEVRTYLGGPRRSEGVERFLFPGQGVGVQIYLSCRVSAFRPTSRVA